MTIIIYMFKQTSFFYATIGVISLALGGITYVMFRGEAYVSVFVRQLLDIEQNKYIVSNANSFIKNYFADFLWAFSFSSFLHMIYLPGMKVSFVCTFTVVFLGTAYEILQRLNFISGTGDILDILIYLLAAFAVNIINFIRRRKNEKQKIN